MNNESATAEPIRPGLEGVVAAETSLSAIDGEAGRLMIRGIPVELLAEEATFDEVVALLVNGALPNRAVLRQVRRSLGSGRVLSPTVRDAIQTSDAAGQPPVDTLSIALSDPRECRVLYGGAASRPHPCCGHVHADLRRQPRRRMGRPCARAADGGETIPASCPLHRSGHRLGAAVRAAGERVVVHVGLSGGRPATDGITPVAGRQADVPLPAVMRHTPNEVLTGPEILMADRAAARDIGANTARASVQIHQIRVSAAKPVGSNPFPGTQHRRAQRTLTKRIGSGCRQLFPGSGRSGRSRRSRRSQEQCAKSDE